VSRIILSIAAILIAIWVLFALFSAVKGLMHLALVLAILFVGYNLINGLRRRNGDNG
jgi:hypothetical protein